MKKIIYICCFFFGFVQLAQAQDPLFSQFYSNRLYLNPAYAGADNGARVALNYREQWPSIPGRFPTLALGTDFGIAQIGAGGGFQFLRNVEGQGKLSTTQAEIFGSKVLGLYDTPKEKLYLYFGLSAGIINKQIKWEELVFSDQLDPVLGITQESSTIAPPSPSRTFADFGSGTMLRYKKNHYFHTLGLSVSHLSSPNESIMGSGQRLPRKYTVHYQGDYPLKYSDRFHSVYISPGIIYEHQAVFNTLNFGAFLSHGPIFGGLWYRSRHVSFNAKKLDGLIISAGYKSKLSNDWTYAIEYSYDVTLSGLNSNTGGSHEISIVFEFNPIHKRKFSKTKNCRDFKSPSEYSLPIF